MYNKFLKILKIIACTDLFILIVIIAAQVFWRYVLNSPIFWAEEFARILFVWMIMLGLVVSVADGSQAAVTVIVEKLFNTKKEILIINLIVDLLIFIFAVVIFIYGIKITQLVYIQMFPALNIPYSVQYSAMPVSAFMILIVCVFRIKKHMLAVDHENNKGDR